MNTVKPARSALLSIRFLSLNAIAVERVDQFPLPLALVYFEQRLGVVKPVVPY